MNALLRFRQEVDRKLPLGGLFRKPIDGGLSQPIEDLGSLTSGPKLPHIGQHVKVVRSARAPESQGVADDPRAPFSLGQQLQNSFLDLVASVLSTGSGGTRFLDSEEGNPPKVNLEVGANPILCIPIGRRRRQLDRRQSDIQHCIPQYKVKPRTVRLGRGEGGGTTEPSRVSVFSCEDYSAAPSPSFFSSSSFSSFLPLRSFSSGL